MVIMTIMADPLPSADLDEIEHLAGSGRCAITVDPGCSLALAAGRATMGMDPQRFRGVLAAGPGDSDLADDLAQALADDPAAGAFFDTLAQLHRKAYLRWIDSTTRRPDLRAARIAEVVSRLAAGVKQRPRQ